MLLSFIFLGHEIGHNKNKPMNSKVVAIHNTFSPTGKVAPIGFIGAFKF